MARIGASHPGRSWPIANRPLSGVLVEKLRLPVSCPNISSAWKADVRMLTLFDGRNNDVWLNPDVILQGNPLRSSLGNRCRGVGGLPRSVLGLPHLRPPQSWT